MFSRIPRIRSRPKPNMSGQVFLPRKGHRALAEARTDKLLLGGRSRDGQLSDAGRRRHQCIEFLARQLTGGLIDDGRRCQHGGQVNGGGGGSFVVALVPVRVIEGPNHGEAVRGGMVLRLPVHGVHGVQPGGFGLKGSEVSFLRLDCAWDWTNISAAFGSLAGRRVRGAGGGPSPE
jgi:hypothetical protein